ncbi:MAG: hypothetical protein NUK65_06695, partial [Firmicutes bacterium]|nr:hypothetical protein [Bacillota bacterium]
MTPTEVKTRCSHKILLYLLILLGTIIVGCANSSQEAQGNSKLSPLNIIGDVDEVLQVASFRDFTPLETIQHRDMQIEAIALEALLQRAEPFSVDYEILFIGDDGLSALLTNEDLSQCYLTYNLENGWEAINFNHPISSNVKNISDIVVIAAELPLGKGFTIIDTSANLRSFSVGELYQQGYLVVSTLRGRASIEKDGKV